jgi:hypothetical protein
VRELVEKTIHRFPIFLIIAVTVGTNEERHLVRRTDQSIELLQMAIGLLEAARVERIAFLSEQLQRPRRVRQKEIRMIEPKREGVWRALLGIGRLFAFEHAAKGIDEAARRGAGEPRLERAHPGGDCAAPELPVAITCRGSTSERVSR